MDFGITDKVSASLAFMSSLKWSNPGHFFRAQGKFSLSFPCALFLHIFDT